MNERIKKKRILLASVLKPVDEPRMFERMGQSLAANGFEVFILGAPAISNQVAEGVHFIAHKKIQRLSWQRFLVPFQILKRLFQLKPDLVIATTHELLLVAAAYRLFMGKKLIYDVQENYWRNICYTNAFPRTIRPLLAFGVRLKEVMAAPFISQFILAERCYEKQLKFVKDKFTVIENKCKIREGFQRNPDPNFIRLIFTGTMAEGTGIFQAIGLAKKLHSLQPNVRLDIVGFCALPKTLQQIKKEISQHSFINLVGGNEFVHHQMIIDAIATAHAGIIYYPPSPHTEGKVPTKLYEYLALQLPILLQNLGVWSELCAPYSAALEIDFDRPDLEKILNNIQSEVFYSKKTEEMSWAEEEETLLNTVQRVFT